MEIGGLVDVRFFRLCAAVLVSMVVSSAATKPQSVTGRWVAKISSDDEVREIVVALNVETDGRVTGYIQAPQYEERIVEGQAEGDNLTFMGEREANNNTRQRRTYSAVFEDGGAEGARLKVTMPGRGGQSQIMEFTRTSTEPPKPLPPPPPKITAAEYIPVRYNGLARTPPMGWNSWNKFRGRVNDAAVRGMADAMVKSGMKDAGYLYINIDDTWEGTRDEKGNIRANSKFPDMKALADYIHSKGLKL